MLLYLINIDSKQILFAILPYNTSFSIRDSRQSQRLHRELALRLRERPSLEVVLSGSRHARGRRVSYSPPPGDIRKTLVIHTLDQTLLKQTAFQRLKRIISGYGHPIFRLARQDYIIQEACVLKNYDDALDNRVRNF